MAACTGRPSAPISPERRKQPGDNKTEGPPDVENAKQRGYGVVFTIAPSRSEPRSDLGGKRHGINSPHSRWRKNWKDVTPPGLSSWSKISFIEASRFDPAVAYAAVDRSRLDDQTPYLYRTRDYGATWQLITNGIAAPLSCAAFARSREQGLLFAGTELGVYVSFDDGDHWQSLQLNLPVTSVRDLTIHGEDLVLLRTAAPSGFSTTSRLCARRPRPQRQRHSGSTIPRQHFALITIRSRAHRFRPRNRPPRTLPRRHDRLFPQVSQRAASRWRFSMRKQKLVADSLRKINRRPEKHPPLPIAERWFPKPEVLETTPGMHRFVWNLTWGSSGGPSVDEESEYRNPSGPRSCRESTSRLTVDGKTQTHRSESRHGSALARDSRESFSSSCNSVNRIFAETLEARRALAEIGSVQKQLADAEQKLGEQNPHSQVGLWQTLNRKFQNSYR
jgi:hypothetical protein